MSIYGEEREKMLHPTPCINHKINETINEKIESPRHQVEGYVDPSYSEVAAGAAVFKYARTSQKKKK